VKARHALFQKEPGVSYKACAQKPHSDRLEAALQKPDAGKGAEDQ